MQPESQTGTINPVFAGYAANQLQEATGGLQRVFDNLFDIAKGNDPTANGYDRLRATRILYDRGFGKVTKNRPKMPPTESEESNNPTNHSSDSPQTAANPEGGEPALSEAQRSRRVAKLEQKLDDTLGPPQTPADQGEGEPVLSEAQQKPVLSLSKGRRAPIRLDEPGHIPAAPGYTPDLVREAQYYVLEITNYGAELAKILAYIHEPDPEDTSIRACHRITAGLMIVDRVLGAAAELEQPLDHWHDPSLEPNWAYKHPAEIDSSVPLEEIIEADRDARQHVEDMRKEREEFQEEFGDREDTGPCYECTGDYPCEYHMMAEELSKSEEEVLATARGMRNLKIFRDRLYFDERGILRLHPPDYIDDS